MQLVVLGGVLVGASVSVAARPAPVQAANATPGTHTSGSEHHRLAQPAMLSRPQAHFATGSASSNTTVPFAQCPAVGSSPSCAILVVINADRTVSVLGDPSVGPYDGGDDSLVGVQKNSSQPVAAITVSGPSGSGIFGFDRDGLCTYITVPCGTTGYEGPGTSFQFDSTTIDRGEVDFGTTGLAGNSSAYFSLEGALNAASLTVRQGGLIQRYVALGDSYSSGEGNPPFMNATSGCDQSSSGAWPEEDRYPFRSVPRQS